MDFSLISVLTLRASISIILAVSFCCFGCCFGCFTTQGLAVARVRWSSGTQCEICAFGLMSKNALIAFVAGPCSVESADPVVVEMAFVAFVALSLKGILTKYASVRFDCVFGGSNTCAAAAFPADWASRV